MTDAEKPRTPAAIIRISPAGDERDPGTIQIFRGEVEADPETVVAIEYVPIDGCPPETNGDALIQASLDLLPLLAAATEQAGKARTDLESPEA